MHFEMIQFSPEDAEDYTDDPYRKLDEWSWVGIAPLMSDAELFCLAYDREFKDPIPCLAGVPASMLYAGGQFG